MAVRTLREVASSLKLRGGGARLGDVVELLSSTGWAGGPCSSAVSWCPSPDPDPLLGLVALAFALYAIFNGGSTQPDVPTGIRATAVGLLYGHERVGAAIGSFATLWALSNLGISGTMWIAAGIAGVGVVSYTAPELGAGACTRPSGCELTAIILPMSDIPFHTSPLTWSSRSAG